MADTVKIIEVAVLAGNVFVVFSDGRVTFLHREELYSKSVEPPHYPDHDMQ
jgi:hypothetical protein